MIVLNSRTTPVVASTGPDVFTVICIPVAKIRTAMRGRADSANRAVVKLPSSRNPGVNVPTIEPRIRGISMSPPGMRFMPSNRGMRDFGSDSAAMAGPPNKKLKGSDEGSKLPMKKMLRKTVGGGVGKEERENLSITNFSSSIGPAGSAGRRLRSHGGGS